MNNKRVYCIECKENTFRDINDYKAICTGCGNVTPKKVTKSRTISLEGLEEIAAPEPLENNEFVEAQYAAVVGRMHKLSKMEKAVLDLVVEEKTHKEISEILSISVGEVGTYLKRARIKLR